MLITKNLIVNFFYIVLFKQLVFYKIKARENYHVYKGADMEAFGRNPYMDYRNRVPFMDLSGFVAKQDFAFESQPAESLKMQLFKKKCSGMINLRRLKYRSMCEAYRRANGN